MPVFDRAQVKAGEHATPLEPPCEPLSGDSHEHLLEPLERFAGSLGFTVSFETIDGSCGGWCDHRHRRIVVDAGQAANAKVRVLIHEIAHAMGVDYRQYCRAQAEVIVDTVSFVIGSSVGLALGGETISYVAGWGESGALQAVSEFATTIDTLARRIEEALDGQPLAPAPGLHADAGVTPRSTCRIQRSNSSPSNAPVPRARPLRATR